jgi:RNA polymerase sigma factor (sigma-70 family)
MMTDDMELVREYAARRSEPAFEKLVARHLNMVHSAALRRVGDPQLAEEIAQAVFLILACKAGSLGPKTILPGWLYRTARYAAADALKTQRRRQAREQEAYMESTLNEGDGAAWKQIAPMLEGAMDSLSEGDRDAVVLRFFEGKALNEVGAAMGVSEGAARKRVSRALERLRKFFSKRGVTLSAVLIAAAVSANAVQAAPAGMAATVSAVALKGAAAGGSTLTLAKGALKLMAWAKAKTSLVAAGVILATGATAVLVSDAASRPGASQRQRLEDGSVLVLNRVLVDSKIRIAHGTEVAKLLGKFVPTNGVHLLGVNLNRQTEETFVSGDKSWLVAEFRLTGPNAANHPLVKPAFYRQFRFVFYGESGIEFVQELWARQFRSYPDGYYGYVVTSRFPRDSHWLGCRVERRQTQAQGGPWQKVADLKVRNPVRPTHEPWVAKPVPVTNSDGSLDFVLGEVTVKTIPYQEHDIWNHLVTMPMEVRSNGILLSNWSASYVRAEDAIGNWDFFASHRSLDPRYVWKLDVDFEPESNFSDEILATIRLPRRSSTITTNVLNVPVTISWDGYWVDASIPTSQTNLALKFVNAADDEGANVYNASGSWGQYQFRKGSFMTRRENVLTMDFKPTTVTVAVVPNVHATFYTQPRLVVEGAKN